MTSFHAQHAPVYVAGHRGMVGAALVRALTQAGCGAIITRTHAELDLTNQAAVAAFFAATRPRLVYLAAARVGGIHANDRYPAEFIYQNLMIEANVIDAAYRHGCRRPRATPCAPAKATASSIGANNTACGRPSAWLLPVEPPRMRVKPRRPRPVAR